jgi:amino-acid N-acetyltransferase
MNNHDLTDQVDTIRQTFGYLQNFRDAIFVIKVDSALTRHPLFPIFIRDVTLLHNSGIKIVLVPGTRMRIDEILKSFGVECESKNGFRISTEEAIPFIKMAAFDVSNKLMTLLAENSTNAVIGNWVRARSVGVKDGVDYQSTGRVDKIDGKAIMGVLNDSMIPIFPNIGWSKSGKPYNISTNELALQISSELKADKLFFVTEMDGIMGESLNLPPTTQLNDDGKISQLTITEVEKILESTNKNFHEDEVLELLYQGHKAAKGGVKRVHIVDGKIDGILLKEIFSNLGMGTMIYTNQLEAIRECSHRDIPDILRITSPLIASGVLVERPLDEITESIKEYQIYEVDSTIHGCGALKQYGEDSAEIYSVAVDDSYALNGTGRRIIAALVTKAVSLDYKQLFLLTTQTTDWFIDRGFTEGDVNDLPKAKREKYNYKRNSRVLFIDLTNESEVEKILENTAF